MDDQAAGEIHYADRVQASRRPTCQWATGEYTMMDQSTLNRNTALNFHALGIGAHDQRGA